MSLLRDEAFLDKIFFFSSPALKFPRNFAVEAYFFLQILTLAVYFFLSSYLFFCYFVLNRCGTAQIYGKTYLNALSNTWVIDHVTHLHFFPLRSVAYNYVPVNLSKILRIFCTPFNLDVGFSGRHKKQEYQIYKDKQYTCQAHAALEQSAFKRCGSCPDEIINHGIPPRLKYFSCLGRACCFHVPSHYAVLITFVTLQVDYKKNGNTICEASE